jgi:hypothetical protein
MARTDMTTEETLRQAQTQVGGRAARAMRAENTADPQAAARAIGRRAQEAEETAAERVLDALWTR